MSARPRLYASVNIGKPQELYDYENLKPTWGVHADYEIVRKLGRGKYSEVFQGVNVSTQQAVVIKALKPVRKSKVKREIKVLQNLAGCKGVPRLLDVVRDDASKVPSLILEYSENDVLKALLPRLTDFDVRFYMYELFRILDTTHSLGIMHRDVKPGNLMIHHATRQLRLIDWGLADFYIPMTRYNVRVASRYYKAPELLLNCEQYHYSVDVWSAAVVFAGLIFKKEPFFHGHDNLDQLVKIARVVGSEELAAYVDKYELDVPGELEDILSGFPPKPLSKFVNSDNQHLAVPEALDLLGQVLKVDHSERLLAKEAMDHSYFAPVKELWAHVSASGQGPLADPATLTARVLLSNTRA